MTKIISKLTEWFGSITAILLSFALVAAWAIGLFFIKDGFNNNIYQLAINTVTTVVTFNMVFIIQSTQNRDNRALHTKLDAILEALGNIEDEELVGLENLPDREIKEKHEHLIEKRGDIVK